MPVQRVLLRSGEEFRIDTAAVYVGKIRYGIEGVRGAVAGLFSRGMSIDVPGAPLRLEFTDRKTRESAMEALARKLGGRIVRRGIWGKLDIRKPKV